MDEHGLKKSTKAKRFWVSAVGLVIIIITSFSPTTGEELAQARESILGVIALLVGGYSIQDAAREIRNPQEATEQPTEATE